jgi:hypothetical protein
MKMRVSQQQLSQDIQKLALLRRRATPLPATGISLPGYLKEIKLAPSSVKRLAPSSLLLHAANKWERTPSLKSWPTCENKLACSSECVCCASDSHRQAIFSRANEGQPASILAPGESCSQLWIAQGCAAFN